jgi:hypothetical protein|tara:strand:+ start:990 stop:1922 length:933 start_codon:yes stop_codon:yes gene_type:complete
MSIINTVRATVLSIANKNNFGYITPNDFNLYAKQAQLDIFEDYFYQYNSWLVKQNARVSGSGYADIVKGLVEVLDYFSLTKSLISSNGYDFTLPEDYYLINKINYYPNLRTSGSVTGGTGSTLIDTNALFITNGVKPTDLLANSTNSGEILNVLAVTNETTLVLSGSISVGDVFTIVANSSITEVERVSQNKIFYLNATPLTAPSTSFPAYVLGGNNITVYPTQQLVTGTVLSQYIRYPKDPNWTYLDLISNGEPSFNETAVDYQDFELPISDQTNLINKILQYAGLSIRDKDVMSFGKIEEQEANQQEG